MALAPAAPNSPKGRFGAALDGFLSSARRPNGKRWTNEAFAGELSLRGVDRVSDPTIRNWRQRRSLPTARNVIDAILDTLFGSETALAADRAHLFGLWAAATNYTAPPPPILGQRPAPPARYHGRAQAHAQAVATLLVPPCALLLHGTGGIGKTTLAHAVLNDPEIEEMFDERRWYAPLDPAKGAEDMGIAIVRATGLDPAAHRLESALAHMSEAPGLLVLDNLETPWRAETMATEALLSRLAALPGLALLATFRGDASPDGPIWHAQPVDPVDDDTALAILHDHAPKIAATDPSWPDFRAALGGLPLAIALIAHRARAHATLEELWQEWQSQGTSIAHRLGVRPSNLTSLDYSIALSVDHASEPALRLFALLGKLPAGLADEDRTVLLRRDALNARDDLLRLGLAHAPPGRLDLLPPIRRHALAHPVKPEDAAGWPRHFLALVVREERRMRSDGAAAFARLAPEVPNIEMAFAAAAHADSLPAILGYADLARFHGAGSTAPLHTLSKRCEAASDTHGQADALYCVGQIDLARSGHASAQDCFRQALALYRHVGDRIGEARCLGGLGEIALRRSDLKTACNKYQTALPLFRTSAASSGDACSRGGHAENGEANCLRGLGDIAANQTDHATARDRYNEALSIFRRTHNVRGEANCLLSLGSIAAECSDLDTAGKSYEEALPLFRRVGDALGEANCIKNLGDIAQRRAEYDDAQARFDAAMRLFRRVRNLRGQAHCFRGYGDIALRRSDYDIARTRFDEALQIFRRISDVLGEANCTARLADVALRRAEYGVTRNRYDEALPLYRRIGNVLGEANCILGLGHIASAQGDIRSARTQYEVALSLYCRIPEPYSIGVTHLYLANLPDAPDREFHRDAACAAWLSIDRADLIAQHLSPPA